jgi:hypothetical protein
MGTRHGSTGTHGGDAMKIRKNECDMCGDSYAPYYCEAIGMRLCPECSTSAEDMGYDVDRTEDDE